MVVPFAAGGPTDSVARSLAEAMRPTLKQTVIVENKAGAGGTLGSSYVSRANPDGYTVLLMHVGFTTAPSLYKKPNYNPIDGFEPIGLVVDVPMTIVGRSDFPANNIKELVEYVKKNKDKVSLANAGIGAASHLCGVMFANGVGVDLLTVPYKGTGPAMNDLVASKSTSCAIKPQTRPNRSKQTPSRPMLSPAKSAWPHCLICQRWKSLALKVSKSVSGTACGSQRTPPPLYAPNSLKPCKLAWRIQSSKSAWLVWARKS